MMVASIQVFEPSSTASLECETRKGVGTLNPELQYGMQTFPPHLTTAANAHPTF